jgi:hypothetical protein
MKAPRIAHVWDRHPQDWYVEPEWCSRRLFAAIEFKGSILDPACGLGRIPMAAREAGHTEVFAMDIERRTTAIDVEICDWLKPYHRQWDNIVSNPPFGLCSGAAPEFVERCLQRAKDHVALLLPTKWLHGDQRSRWLEQTTLKYILALTPRPSMPPGPVIAAGETPGNGTTDFCWFIWRHGYYGAPQAGWLRRDP